MNKLIIDNRTDLDDSMALALVVSVMMEGRVSNNGTQYCFLTIFKYAGKEYQVASFKNKKSDRFVIENH